MTVLLAAALQVIVTPAACTPGIYVVAEGGALQALPETRTARRKVTGLAGAVLLGPFGGKMKVKSVLDGARAPTAVKAGKPTFRFCFAPSAVAPAGSDYVGVDAAASTPGEYYLVRFEAGATQRELALSEIGSFSGPKSALSKALTPFRAEQTGPGSFEVLPTRDLPPGEYGFMQPPLKAESARKKDATERVFAFSVVP